MCNIKYKFMLHMPSYIIASYIITSLIGKLHFLITIIVFFNIEI